MLWFPTGQRDRSSFIVPGQRDNRTTQNLAMGRDGPGQPVKIRDETRDGTITIFRQNPGWDAGRDNHYFSVKIRESHEQLSFFDIEFFYF